MSESGPPADHEWPRGFEEHTLAQRRRLSRLPLEDRLQWLEEAHRFVLALQRHRREGP